MARLTGWKQSEELAEQLFDTLYEFFLKLDDGVIIHPGHGHRVVRILEIG